MTVQMLVTELEERYPNDLTSMLGAKGGILQQEIDKRLVILDMIREIKVIGGLKDGKE